MLNIIRFLLGWRKIGGVWIYPLVTKIILIFVFFLILSNLTSNTINLLLHRKVLIEQLQSNLKNSIQEVYLNIKNQYEIFQFGGDLKKIQEVIVEIARRNLANQNSISFAVKKNGKFFFYTDTSLSINDQPLRFMDIEKLNLMEKNLKQGIYEGFISFTLNQEKFLGVYQYSSFWNIFLVQAERSKSFLKPTYDILVKVSFLLILLLFFFSFIGIQILQYIFRYLFSITQAIVSMNKKQIFLPINLSRSPNDDIKLLGLSFNALSQTVNALLNIFKRFTSKEVVLEAYNRRETRLDGRTLSLTCLFSDIRNFTFITETLQEDIVRLLNVHYSNAIGHLFKRQAIVASIIGDALLGVFGVLESEKNKSHQAILAAYEIQAGTKELRNILKEKRQHVIGSTGYDVEIEKLFQAMNLDVGVGIDGGRIFYGNIGSFDHMTNTVIGDEVNSASRLEGLTKVYNVPVICSEFVKNDIINNTPLHGMYFVELDRIFVKGKTIPKTIFWPILDEHITGGFLKQISFFSFGLQLYYSGDFKIASDYFLKSGLPITHVFTERMEALEFKAPQDWNGVWKMTTK